MTDFIKMDIFFVVATATVVILGILIGILLIRALRILKNVEHISENLSAESDTLREDFQQFRSRVREEGFRFRTLGKLFRSIAGRFVSKKPRK